MFTSKGRYDPIDACTLLPSTETLAPLVRNGAQESGDSRPKTFLDLGDQGNMTSQCKWSSVPPKQDRPFRTVRIHAKTMTNDGRRSAEKEADHDLDLWHRNNGRNRARPVTVAERAYATTDKTVISIFVVTEIYDLHVKFRDSNVLVDVSARTHTPPGDKERALVLGLARDVAERLRTHAN
ncbi:hypothetical protein [Actinomadura rudentiformis]|uniref:Uncharacterized protein n=1 Tax=Actinomadura rudentiformis TaxID=359158 RepID=A0A6H9YIP1_9ACTN|nr:hypothetical protein [Actinomadura rudentiformis]KAB2340589.1 hypothetical protein F8566_44505 [Actinomadura rudentiformis]